MKLDFKRSIVSRVTAETEMQSYFARFGGNGGWFDTGDCNPYILVLRADMW